MSGNLVASRRSPLVPLRDGRGAAPFFCVHPSSGSLFCYLRLARALGSERPVSGLEAPGLQGEALPLQRVEDMAARYLEAVAEAQPNGPYHLGGWSIGGTVAFEMARRLEAAGRTVALLAVIDSALPPPGASPPGLDALLARFVRDLAGQLGAPAPELDEGLAVLTTSEKVAAVGRRLREAGLISADVGSRQLRGRLAVFVSNIRAAYAYAPGAYSGRTTMFLAEASAGSEVAWRPFARGGMTTHVVPGDHHSILHEPHVERLAAGLRAALHEVGR